MLFINPPFYFVVEAKTRLLPDATFTKPGPNPWNLQFSSNFTVLDFLLKINFKFIRLL